MLHLELVTVRLFCKGTFRHIRYFMMVFMGGHASGSLQHSTTILYYTVQYSTGP